jgi:hypothetical protein
MRASATVFVRQGSVYVVSSSQTVDGFWVDKPPFFKCETFDAAETARMVKQALNQSRTGVPNPDRHAPPKIVEFAGVKTYTAFLRGTLGAAVDRSDEGVIKITPMKNEGGRRGFTFFPDRAVVVSDNIGLAEAITTALNAAE